MKRNLRKRGFAVEDIESSRQVRPWLRITTWVASLGCLGALVAGLLRGRGPQVAPPAQPEVTQEAQSVAPQLDQAGVVAPSQTVARPSGPTVEPGLPRPQVPLAEVTPGARQLVESLVKSELAGGSWTEEQAAAWKQQFKALIHEGSDGVAAIREFLAQNLDYAYGEEGQRLLGYNSARAAMFEALAEIGGPGAVTAMSEALQGTADPREIAVLFQNLEKLDPGTHQQAALDAARQALAMAAAGNLPGRDVAPLFEVMEKVGVQGAVADLEQNAAQWGIYSMIALAQLPDGAGIPSLLQFAAGEGSAANVAALQMLAQVAPQSEDARNALLQLARDNKLSQYSWAALEPYLAGAQQFFLNSAYGGPLGKVSPDDLRMANAAGQQVYTAPLGALTAEQIAQRGKFIDDLLAVTADPYGRQRLQAARTQLATRLPQVASAPQSSPQ